MVASRDWTCLEPRGKGHAQRDERFISESRASALGARPILWSLWSCRRVKALDPAGQAPSG